jgi:hypothetical protein
MKATITVKLDADVLRGVRILASEEGLSFSALLTAELRRLRDSAADSTAREGALWHGSAKGSIWAGHALVHATNCTRDKSSTIRADKWTAAPFVLAGIANPYFRD